METSTLTMTREHWWTVPLRSIQDYRGNLTPIEGGVDIGFEIARVYYIYDIPGGSHRAGHAHRRLRQLYIAASGSFDVTLTDGARRETVSLNRPDMGLQIGPGVWRDITNISAGAVCLVLASAHYDEDDYIRHFEDFQQLYVPQ